MSEKTEEFKNTGEFKIYLEYLDTILDSYKWIKIKPFQEEDNRDPNVEWKFAYNELRSHHKDETEFLVKTCRELATRLLKEYGKA